MNSLWISCLASNHNTIRSPSLRPPRVLLEIKAMSRKSRMTDCEQEELKLLLEYKAKWFSSRLDDIGMSFNLERKYKILDGHVKKLMESGDLEVIRLIDSQIFGDPRLVDGLKPVVVELLVKILDENNQDSIKGVAARILGFANFDECGLVIKKKAIEILVKLMSADSNTIAIPVVDALTRLAYVSHDYSSIIVERGAFEGALEVVKTIHWSPNMLRSLSKFMAVIVFQVKVPSCKVGIIVTILGKMLGIRLRDLFHIVRACYALSHLLESSAIVVEKEICNKLIGFINDPDDLVAHSALRVVADIAKWGKPCEIQILTKDCEFLQCLGRIELCSKPKMFRKGACNIISNLAAKGGTSIKDMHEVGLIDTLHKLLEADEFDVKMEAVCAIYNIILGDRYEEISEHDKGRYSTEYSHYEKSLFM